MHDVLVIGGGCIGSATALHLLRAEPGLDVVVLEPDPTYRSAATTRATGGVRTLFSRPENIALSRYTHDVIANWDTFTCADADGYTPALNWRNNGYLFICSAEQREALREDYHTQVRLGVDAGWLEPDELGSRYPDLESSDLGAAVSSPRDGWLDPHAFLHGMRRTAGKLGATFRPDRAVTLSAHGNTVTTVELASGEKLHAAAVVNAAGVDAPALAAQVGMPVPVEPMPRFEHYVEVPRDYSAMPFLKDPHGLAVRPEGLGLSVGLVDFDRPADHDLPRESSYFDEHVWPALAHRFPALDRLKLRKTWAGHYDQNRLDGNMIIGNAPGLLDNFYLATGFSGHGLMHAPGVGRALSELILRGAYVTVDLTRMEYARVCDNEPYPELTIR